MTLIAKPQTTQTERQGPVAYIRANKERSIWPTLASARRRTCGLLFQSALKTDPTTVPFSGTGPAMTALLGGNVDVMCDQTTNTTGQIKAAR